MTNPNTDPSQANDPNIDTMGGATIRGNVSNTGGTNVFGGYVGTINNNYQQKKGAEKPQTYLPFLSNPDFQARAGEFDKLEQLLFHPATSSPTRLGLVGIIGMGGIGKTRLAVELALRFQDRFPAGIFWLAATGTTIIDWQRSFASLALDAAYLPDTDEPGNPDNERMRATHICRYLAQHHNALLILDNVEAPNLLEQALPSLAGEPLRCPILYTSRDRSPVTGVEFYQVEQLSPLAALHLLLKNTRPGLLKEVVAGSKEAEALAAHFLCQFIGYLPLALIHLKALLAEDQNLSLVELTAELKSQGRLALLSDPDLFKTSLYSTFQLSWSRINNVTSEILFKLAALFPEAASIPLWLLGLAAGLGENPSILKPLGKALLPLKKLSLVESLVTKEGLVTNEIRLHPLVREFALKLMDAGLDSDQYLRDSAAKNISDAFEDLSELESRAKQIGYWSCLQQIRKAQAYLGLLAVPTELERLERVERCLDMEGHLLGNSEHWPKLLPGLFYQQIYNRAMEFNQPLFASRSVSIANPWLRQLERVNAEDPALVRTLTIHSGSINGLAFSSDGLKVATASSDNTARLWDIVTGQLLATFQGHSEEVTCVAFNFDNTKVITGSVDCTARIWDCASGDLISTFNHNKGIPFFPISSVTFSPDSSKVLVGDDHGTLFCWDTVAGNLLASFSLST